MVKKAAELAQKHGWFLARQFENEANPAYHRNTTGPEILEDFAGKRLDFFVTGWGTGGTLTGVGQMLRLARPDVQIIATEPAAASLLAGKSFSPHKIQGWTPDFVPAVLDKEVPHRLLTVTDVEAIEAARSLARSEGIFCGISSGGTFAAATESRCGSAGRIRHPGDAAGYGRALSFDSAVRRHCRRQRSRALRTAAPTPATTDDHPTSGREEKIGARRYAQMPDPFPMWRGGALHGARIAYETWGTLNEARDNAVLLFTGLSPSAHAASSHDDPSDGWWQRMVGSGAGYRHRSVLRDLRELTRQLFRLDGSRLHRPGDG